MGGVLGDDLLVSVDVVAVLQVLVLAPAALRVAVTAELLRHALARPRAQEEGGGGAGRAAGARGGAGLLAPPATILFLRAAAAKEEYEIRLVRTGLRSASVAIIIVIPWPNTGLNGALASVPILVQTAISPIVVTMLVPPEIVFLTEEGVIRLEGTATHIAGLLLCVTSTPVPAILTLLATDQSMV